jgi:hypothetical protein
MKALHELDLLQSVNEATELARQDLIADLAVNIILAKKAYYSGKPIMNDYKYDMMEQDLKRLDEKHPVNYLVGYSEEYDWWLTHYKQK